MDYHFVVAKTDILPRTRETAKRHTNISINIDLGYLCHSGTFDFCHKTYNYTYYQKEISFYRGYTGHEHLLGEGYLYLTGPEILPQLEIINMNGRIYDPILGQFMQADNNIQTPEDFIGYDRYAYCRNNPLVYTDPSGEFINLIVAGIIGGVSNLIMNSDKIDNPWDAFGYFAIGAVAGALTAGVGAGFNAMLAPGGSFMAGFMGTASYSTTGFINGFVTGATGGFAGGFTTGLGNAAMENKSAGQVLNSGLENGIKGLFGGGLLGGVSGGIEALNNNRDFMTGNIKMFEAKPNLYASNGDNYIDPFSYSSNGYCTNGSAHDVFYKPEDGIYGLKNVIKPGQGCPEPLDGVATFKTKINNKVFKIPGKKFLRPQAYVTCSGDVMLSYDPLTAAFTLGKTISGYQFGWMSYNQLDEKWLKLFELGKSIK